MFSKMLGFMMSESGITNCGARSSECGTKIEPSPVFKIPHPTLRILHFTSPASKCWPSWLWFESRGESRKRVGAALRFGTLRNLTGDHRWPASPFRSIVGGLDSRVVEESQDLAAIILPADAIQQPLVIRVG